MWSCVIFFFNGTATTEIYTYLHTLSLHDALPIFDAQRRGLPGRLADQRRPAVGRFGYQHRALAQPRRVRPDRRVLAGYRLRYAYLQVRLLRYRENRQGRPAIHRPRGRAIHLDLG